MKHVAKIKSFLTGFRSSEAGAVTVDFVMVTAGVVGLGVAVMVSVGGSTFTASENVGTEIAEIDTENLY